MATTKTTSPAIEPIDRLEEKIKVLVNMIGRLKGEQARAAEDNVRLTREIDALRSRMEEAEGATAEVSVLRDERDQIRARVSDMLQQLDSLNL